MRRLSLTFTFILALAALTRGLFAQAVQAPAVVAVTPIDRPTKPLPSEADSAGVTRFSFLAYGDSRSDNASGDGQVLNVEHNRLIDGMLATVEALSSTPLPVRFVLQSGDAVLRGASVAMWNVSFTPIVDRLTGKAGIPYFFAAGNHDVTGMPLGDPGRAPGLKNTLAAMANLMPPDGSPRRLSGYPTYAFGYGNLFVIALDSNIASDAAQLGWVTNQLDHLDRSRYPHIVVFFHHPVYSSGPHGGLHLEPPTIALRELYMPLFRKHHVRLLIAGHDHLFDHWIERYSGADGKRYRLDQIISGGGGAPIYTYSGEPDLTAYRSRWAPEQIAVEHIARPGPRPTDNPHHFVVIHVDGDRLSLEVVGSSGAALAPYNGRSRVDLFDRDQS